MISLQYSESTVTRWLHGPSQGACQTYRPIDQQASRAELRSPPHPILEAMLKLRAGWDGDGAPVPTRLAVETAKSVCDVFDADMQPFDRVAPSVVGGVGLTRTRGNRKFYVEVLNSGDVYAMESAPPAEPYVYPYRASSYREYIGMAIDARKFLNG